MLQITAYRCSTYNLEQLQITCICAVNHSNALAYRSQRTYAVVHLWIFPKIIEVPPPRLRFTLPRPVQTVQNVGRYTACMYRYGGLAQVRGGGGDTWAQTCCLECRHCHSCYKPLNLFIFAIFSLYIVYALQIQTEMSSKKPPSVV